MLVRHPFFAVLSRMKYIRRWALMRNNQPENICEHSFDVAVLAHGLAELSNARFGTDYDVGLCALLSLYHDTTEIFTGDLPTPVKYKSDDIQTAYRHLEEAASHRLLDMLPDGLEEAYVPLLLPDKETPEYMIMKAADKLSALIKCEEELKQGNREFSAARETLEQSLLDMRLPVVDMFLREFLPDYRLTLDELPK
ncbi:MAG: 5'-deoxynucleotidase [Clostridia bacterium]|nr:5'-deoxynucleotidase [Clostridia bacterium]